MTYHINYQQTIQLLRQKFC